MRHHYVVTYDAQSLGDMNVVLSMGTCEILCKKGEIFESIRNWVAQKRGKLDFALIIKGVWRE